MPPPPPPTPPPECGPPPPPPHINCGLPPEFFFVAPASSFHHHAEPATTINFDPHSLNVGVIPLLTASPCIPAAAEDDAAINAPRSRGMQLWQHQQLQQKPLNNADHANLLTNSGGGGGASSSAATATCQDCGNQAKKDCPHRRCRTCCKSRGYDCSTHVKSTWVPAARRRERQLMGGNAAASSQSTSGTKKPRLAGASQTTTASHTSTSNTTPPRSFDTTSSHLDASLKESLPGQVRAPAVFKCVRVTAVDDGEDEFAYQAVVKIGGHIFKGFLYDQGFEGRESFPDISELHLGGVGGSGSGRPALDPSDIYAASGGGLLGGSAYGNQIN
ncbi:LOW QUALITY PROTEIN: protein LATERAL ROOT PRIMORDIUM 1-like [Salvia hispanica]|uniref:LOW QUALITY PROTEIN: protein LATERAL ROOT PRIMORDIUM 1-like n=1 Tax=Salvia hispanica TaxID=49212 RepID=UPI0020092978|nr:LOW QUALITY PROTEIN: protein LATERAL ROOT PRIMORDIUM 1-like [Salvia hispanica]